MVRFGESRLRRSAARGVWVAGAGVVVFAAAIGAAAEAAKVTVRRDEKAGWVEVLRDAKPVLRYRFATVPVPAEVKGRKYAEARSDYIHPLYGPDGETLTADYAGDHPHHRGVYWAWPEVYYKGGCRDLHALQGVFARPVKLLRAESSDEGAVIEAESVWKWGDTEPIVKELAILCVPARGPAEGWWVDLEFRFTALVDGVSVARRGQTAYGGLNLRTTLHGGQKLSHHADPPAAAPRRNWGQIAGVPKGGKEAVAIAILEHAANPDYPGEWIKFPDIDWLQPTFPAKGTKYALPTASSGKDPLVLRYRLWVRKGAASAEELANAWDGYNKAGARSP